MKIDMSCSAKRNHTVTVPREYIEGLEEFYRDNMENKYNIRGDIRKVMLQPGFDSPNARESMTLFITDNEIKMDEIIIVDEEGRERGRFKRP